MVQPELIREVEQRFFTDSEEPLTHQIGSFACLYGSSLYKEGSPTSDIDMFYVAPSESHIPMSSETFAHFVRNLHTRYGRKIDEEVPFDNKLTYTPRELTAAVTYACFEDSGHELTIPKIRKEEDFLASREIKLRLALNALTTPNHIIGPGTQEHARYTKLAELAVCLLGIALQPSKKSTPTNIKDALSMSSGGDIGEMFLGYKVEYSAVDSHMERFIETATRRLFDDGHITAYSSQADFYRLGHGSKPSAIMAGYLQSIK